ncbi:MAG: FHA domain-containing protein [Ottowia sp.]|uniref:FHA domain-containing protein n=1 Tax=Ottowia sp. TaxID=1898956 RepID=UPI0039E377D8
MTTTPSITLAFIDLTGSTAAYETLGNAQAAGVISKLTQWIGRVCEAHGGRVVKFLGDGVLATFPSAELAVEATVFMQQSHTERLLKWPAPLRILRLKIGLASGQVVHMADDTYGDPVNLASRLSDMAGPDAIWADESLMMEVRARRSAGQFATGGTPAMLDGVRYRSLGMIRVRGMAQAHSVFQIEWNEELSSDLMTVQGVLHDTATASDSQASIALAWLGTTRVLAAKDLPVVIGRIPDNGFVVSDQRVSRQHARIEWQDGAFVLTDLSSFGSWVRFTEKPSSEVHLRRSQCILHSTGEVALGASFSDFSAPVVAFDVRVDNAGLDSPTRTRSLFDEAAGH